MDFSMNLKRRRHSWDSLTEECEKKRPPKPAQETKSHSQTPSLAQSKGGNDKITSSTRATSSNNPSPTTTKNTPADLTEFPLSPKSPSLSPISTPKLLSRSHSVTTDSTPPASSPIASKQRGHGWLLTKSHVLFNAFHFLPGHTWSPKSGSHFLKFKTFNITGVVIVVGNGHGDTSSNPGRDWLHFT